MQIACMKKNHAQNRTEHVEYDFVSHNDSEIHAKRNGNLERREVSKIKDRVKSQRCSGYQRPSETFCGCGRILQSITAELMKQAEQRIN